MCWEERRRRAREEGAEPAGGGQTEVLHRDGQGRPPEEDDLRREHRAGSRAARGPAWPNLEGRESWAEGGGQATRGAAEKEQAQGWPWA